MSRNPPRHHPRSSRNWKEYEMTREVMQQAMEALDVVKLQYTQNRHINDAITAIKAALAQPEQQAEPCIGKDPRCPCQDGDACHYKDCWGTKAWPVPQAEPVGEVVEVNNDGFRCEFSQRLAVGTKLYATPPAAQPVQEPVAWAVQACSKMWRGEFAEIDAKAEAKRIGGTCVAFALYTEPPQREWVGLTDEEQLELYVKYEYEMDGWGLFYDAIEASLRSKNK